MINAKTMRQAILDRDRDMFERLLIKIVQILNVQPRSSELIPPILKGLGSFVSELEIDLNNKSIDFYEFESAEIKNLYFY